MIVIFRYGRGDPSNSDFIKMIMKKLQESIDISKIINKYTSTGTFNKFDPINDNHIHEEMETFLANFPTLQP